jgi:riboflavin kinase / FMN adenylyltransferase
VDITVVYPFSKKFAALESASYIEEILKKSVNVKYLVIGYDHKFGQNRSGDIEVLKQFSDKLGFEVEEISARDIDNIAVSSSKIRKALEEGNLRQASEFLGHRYFLNGTVIKGKQLGRTLGYPTANLKPESPEKLLPKTGVYFVEVQVKGNTFHGMLNIGTNPTTDDDNKIKIEVNILDFDDDIYGETVQLNFIKRLRDEEKFSNLQELKKALDEDKRLCLQLMREYI